MLQGNVDDGGEECLSGHCKTTNSVSVSSIEASLSKVSLINESQQGKCGGSTELEVRLTAFCVLFIKLTV